MTVGDRRRQPSLAQLRAFAAVAEHLHFRDAAGALGMSQPALSGALSALEETLGVTLVERTTRRVLLTPAGEQIEGLGIVPDLEVPMTSDQYIESGDLQLFEAIDILRAQ